MSLVNHPLMTLITAGRANHLTPCTQSVDLHNDHDGKPSDQYEQDKPLPPQARGQETEHWKIPQYTQSTPLHLAPTPAAPQTWQDRRCTPTHRPRLRKTSTPTSHKKEALDVPRWELPCSQKVHTCRPGPRNVCCQSGNITPRKQMNMQDLDTSTQLRGELFLCYPELLQVDQTSTKFLILLKNLVHLRSLHFDGVLHLLTLSTFSGC